jgi:hypothetical protein
VQAFVRNGKGSRSTYFNNASKIVAHQPVTGITLSHRPPVNSGGNARVGLGTVHHSEMVEAVTSAFSRRPNFQFRTSTAESSEHD